MKINFGVHLGFAITRYPEPEVWTRIISKQLGLSHVQFISDLLPPELPKSIINEQIKKINDNCEKYNIKIDNTFTSPRYNFIAHPNQKISDYWFKWFKKFINITSKLNAKGTGSVLGIQSFNTLEKYKKNNLNYLIKKWNELSIYAKNKNLEYLLWEPMSVEREFGETISKTSSLNSKLNKKKNGVPIKLCLDVDHGDVMSLNHKDKDPYEWLRRVGKNSPVIHMKQRTKNVHGHKPFTKEFNKVGLIHPKKIVDELKKLNVKEIYIYLELSFREREPYDSNVLKILDESINYWYKYIT
tara:strand:+ start:75 stop:971 length:897 start_codon:yes stop_codon:yes gene_type:complete